MSARQKIIRNKMGLLRLAWKHRTVSRTCKVMRNGFYRRMKE